MEDGRKILDLDNTIKGLHYSVDKKNNAYTLSGEWEGGVHIMAR